MLVELKKLKPNPYREFAVDPIDEDNVAALAQSIKDNGFWGGVVLRQAENGEIQIGAGHHRIDAAMKAGIKTADLFVGRFDDPAMIRIYATENATQRGNSSTAIAGSIASAIRFLVKGVITGTIHGEKFFTMFDLATTQRQFDSDGIGRKLVVAFLKDIPGVNDGTVQQQLANLKASGDYSRIVKEVGEEIERENKKALEDLKRQEEEHRRAEEAQRLADERLREAEARRKEAAKAERAAKEEAAAKRAKVEAERAELERQRAEAMAQLAEKRRKESDAKMKEFDALRTTRDTSAKATAKADAHEKTFDFEGVARHLKNENQVRVFRDCVLGAGIKPYLPVSRQASLAQKLVAAAKGQEISGAFIRENISFLLFQSKVSERSFTKTERLAAEQRDVMNKVENRFKDAARNLRTAAGLMVDLKFLVQKHNLKTVKVPGEFRTALDAWTKASAHFDRYWK